MNMKISELIALLTEMQAVSGDCNTNIESVRLKGDVHLDYGLAGSYSYQRDAKRARQFSVWLEGYPDGPQPAKVDGQTYWTAEDGCVQKLG